MVMLCTPAANADVWNIALPLLSVPIPSVVVPSRNVTVPVGVPEFADTVPVKVTPCPTSTVAAEEVTVEVVLDSGHYPQDACLESSRSSPWDRAVRTPATSFRAAKWNMRT